MACVWLIFWPQAGFRERTDR